MNRPRSAANSGLPDNLHRKTDRRNGKTYYSYRDPRTGKDHGLGTDHDSAVRDAKALNAVIYASIRSAKIAALSNPEPEGVTLNKLVMRHLALCEKRKLAENTIRSRKSHTKAWLKALGTDRDIGSLAVRDFVDVIGSYEEAGKVRTALALRTTAVEMWKDAIAEGWAADNLPDKTRAPTPEVQRSRLLTDDFDAIYAVAAQVRPWLPKAMALALVSAQRREDVALFEYRHGAGSVGWVEDTDLCVIQQKTGNRVRIPLEVQIHGFRLADLVKRSGSIITRWMIHHTHPYGNCAPGDPVWRDTITKAFAEARDLAGVTGEKGKTPPTYHEIRSLALRLYQEAYGPAFAQAIAGHKDAATTAIYTDTRGAEWVQVKLA